jgi:hypothetical protein
MTKTPTRVNRNAALATLVALVALLVCLKFYMDRKAVRLERQQRIDACVVHQGLDERRCAAIIDAVDYTISHPHAGD